MSDNLIMDPTTGVPIPVAQFVEKRQAEIANGVEIMNTTTHTNKGYKCSVCNRSFTSLSMLVHHNEKVCKFPNCLSNHIPRTGNLQNRNLYKICTSLVLES